MKSELGVVTPDDSRGAWEGVKDPFSLKDEKMKRPIKFNLMALKCEVLKWIALDLWGWSPAAQKP